MNLQPSNQVTKQPSNQTTKEPSNQNKTKKITYEADDPWYLWFQKPKPDYSDAKLVKQRRLLLTRHKNPMISCCPKMLKKYHVLLEWTCTRNDTRKIPMIEILPMMINTFKIYQYDMKLKWIPLIKMMLTKMNTIDTDDPIKIDTVY